MKIKKIFMIFLILLLLFTSSVSVWAKVRNDNKTISTKDLLLIIDDTIDSIEIGDYPGISYDIKKIKELNIKNIENYYEIAVPYELVDNNVKSILRKAYADGKKVYLYGELTIDNYKETLKLEKFGKYIDSYKADQSVIDNKVYMSFDEEYQISEKHHVVALSENETDSGLLCSIPTLDNKNILIKAVLDDVKHHSDISTFGIVGRTESFNIKTYTSNGSYAILDWILYQDTSETSSTYDYFALKTQTQLVPWYPLEHGTKIEANHKEYRTSDEIVDAKPTDISNTSNIDVSLSLLSVSLSYAINMASEPNIDRTYSSTSDYATWVCDGAYLEGEEFSPSSSWASLASETKAGRKIEFRGTFYDNGSNMSMSTPWKYVSATYDY